MIRDHRIHPQSGGVGDLGVGGDARIHRNDEGHALGGQLVYGPHRHAVALSQTVGYVAGHVSPQSLEVEVQGGHRGDTVHVVVAVNGDALPSGDRFQHPRGGRLHIGHEHGVVPNPLVVAEEQLGGGGVGVAAVAEHAGGQGGDPQRIAQSFYSGGIYMRLLLRRQRPDALTAERMVGFVVFQNRFLSHKRLLTPPLPYGEAFSFVSDARSPIGDSSCIEKQVVLRVMLGVALTGGARKPRGWPRPPAIRPRRRR